MPNQNYLLLVQIIKQIANNAGNIEHAELLEKIMNQTVVINNNNNSGGTATTDASQLTSGTLPDARLSTNVAFKTDVSTAVANLVNSSPATLDTLNELAAALGNDPNFATTITNALAGKANTSDITALQNSVNANTTAIASKASTQSTIINAIIFG